MQKLKNNPHYMEGFFVGRGMIPTIDKTVYRTLEGAIQIKSELIKHQKANFGWDDTQKDVAYNHGLIAAWQKELEDKGPTPVDYQISIEAIDLHAKAIGRAITMEQAELIQLYYPQFKEKAGEDDTDEMVIEKLIKYVVDGDQSDETDSEGEAK